MGHGSGPAVGSTLPRRVPCPRHPRSCPAGGLDPARRRRARDRAARRRRALTRRRRCAPRPLTSTRSSASSPIASTPTSCGRARRGCGSSPTWPWATTTSTSPPRPSSGSRSATRPGVLDETTADLAFLLLLAAARRTSDAEADLRQGRWTGFHIDDFLGVDVHGATLGVVGYGRIGQAVARRAVGIRHGGAAPLAPRHRRHRVGRRPRRSVATRRLRLPPRAR